MIIWFLLLFFLVFNNNKIETYLVDSNIAVLILPGGGYKAVAKDGIEYAQWLNNLGISAYVLNYRPNPYPYPMQDATKAFKELRKQYEIVGVLGESAGGHLAASIQIYDPNNRPDFLILLFPVVSLAKPYRHKGSWRMLFGNSPAPNLLLKYSIEEQVTANNPPTFLVSGGLDESVPAVNSIDYYLHLRRNHVPAELHIFQTAKHGFWNKQGYHPLGFDNTCIWTNLCENWLRENKWLTIQAMGGKK